MPTPGSDSARSPISQAGSHGDRHGDCALVTVTAKPPSQARPGLGPGAHNDSSCKGIRVTVIRVMTPVNPMISDSRAGPGPDRDWFWSDNLPVTRTSTGRLRVGLPLCPLACRPGPCPCSPRFRRAAGPVRRRRTAAARSRPQAGIPSRCASRHWQDIMRKVPHSQSRLRPRFLPARTRKCSLY